MRIALIFVIGIHGLIHLFGFLKAFGLSAFTAMQAPISKTAGLFWLLAFLLFVTTMVLILLQSDAWWIAGLAALIVSQVLIVGYWSDAKFGTIANLLILLATVVAFSDYRFTKMIEQERQILLENAAPMDLAPITKADIINVPPVVQRWLINSGVVGTPRVSTVYLSQELSLRMNPEQKQWKNGTAEQYFTVQPPAFNWTINTSLNSLLSIRGRDKYVDGQGEMQIRLLSVIPVANARKNSKIDQATLQRYLAEIVWFPSASLSPFIQWEEIDDRSAKATMELNGITGSGIFHFDEQDTFQKFVAMRYQGVEEDEPSEWTVIATKTAERNGIRIPTECEASWQLDHQSWTWLKLRIVNIQYNADGISMPSSET